MAHIYLIKRDLKKAIESFDQAYRLALETNEAMGLFNVGRDFGALLVQLGKKEIGIKMLRRSYRIAKEAGLPDADLLAELIRKAESK